MVHMFKHLLQLFKIKQESKLLQSKGFIITALTLALVLAAIISTLLLFKSSIKINKHSPTLSILHAFSGSAPNGANPYASLVTDGKGNFYGATVGGGDGNCGTIFKIDAAKNFTRLYSFSAALEDGSNPYGALVWGDDGALYGTTYSGGSANLGVIFKITPTGVFTQLYSFTYSNIDGANPYAALVQGRDGNFYGTTYAGGPNNVGTVFKLTM